MITLVARLLLVDLRYRERPKDGSVENSNKMRASQQERRSEFHEPCGRTRSDIKAARDTAATTHSLFQLPTALHWKHEDSGKSRRLKGRCNDFRASVKDLRNSDTSEEQKTDFVCAS